MTNSFLHNLDKVDFAHYKPEDVVPALDGTEKQTKKSIQALKKLKTGQRTFENTVLGYTRAMQKFSQIVEIVCHLQYMDERIWTDVQQIAMARYMKLALKLGYDKELYGLLKAFGEAHELNELQSRLLTDVLQDFEEGGIHLPNEVQSRLKKLLQQHTKLADKFSLNITKARSKATLLIDNEDDVHGLPTSFLDRAKADAKGTGATYAIKINDGTYDVVQTYCSSQTTRERMYLAYSESPAKANYTIMFKLLGLRYEIADILGFPTPSHMYMRKRMITNPARAIEFLENLDRYYLPKAKFEYEELKTFIEKESGKTLSNIPQYEYDTSYNFYYTSALFNQKFTVNLDEIKQYFEFSRVLSGMFDCLGELYGVRFERLHKTSWHKDVEVYHIFDGNKLLAEVHCDWFARDHKHGHAWMNRFYASAKTDNNPHIGSVVMNLPLSSSDEPTLMTPEQVSTMWHEFGHFMHQAFQEVTYIEQGMDCVKRDFIEAPSQIMENWALHPDILPRYAFHYKTGRPLPKQYLHALKETELFNVGIKSSRQHFLALLDLKLHSQGMVFSSPDHLYTWVQEFRARTLPGSVHPKYSTLATYAHIASGYISGYYTYKWSEMIQADLFSRFQAEGLLNSEVGAHYRSRVLARGDEVDPDVLIHDFLGRDVDASALLKSHRIIS